MLFCQPNRTFSCSRVLLFPCSPLRTMVKNVVKTRTSKKHKWSPKNRSKHQVCGSSRKQKTGREKTTMWSARKQPTEICGHTEPKPRGQAMWSKAFESREAISHLKGFFLPPVSYCNLEKRVCQVLKITFSLPIILGAINKEKGD